MPVVGADLGGTNVRTAVVDPNGRLLALQRAKLAERSPGPVVALLARTIRGVLEQVSLDLAQADGVGIGVAAQLRGDSGVVASAPNLGWSEVPFGELMKQALGRQVRVVNDVEAICWAEACYGAARGHKDVLTVIPGTGIGGGLVLDGRLYRGATGVAAEIGHVKVAHPGEPCGCGSRGCLEAYLGGANLSRKLRREAAAGWTALAEKAGNDPEAIHPGLIEELALAGDARARELLQELASMFGGVLANAVTLLNPSALVLGGTVLKGCPTLRKLTEEVLRDRVLEVAGEGLAVMDASLGDEAGVIGAAALSGQNPAAN